ncbi:histidine phosphatase family protein [Bacillus sp. EB106-08-02-XG196]|jgi:broad specificity phosphatase PhoE|uniref:histidine phosphatase family protein n=1 Tax=Bacillus sp. EB106-08-02-XG196 TaxID=2737049 RepID=UPI0015C4E1F2|nr:histidine phosphatase family protein [Bacillus sp. EB106-08-02-XG196]NWQ40680.1 histidine phosphatase family protein [Bacillus sp. EB106-08-02-XG196]
MITLYITRHGETEWNREKRMQGWLDSNLTENGIKNAVCLGERLKEIELTAIYSSTSGRTKATANLIRGERDIPVIYDENLREIKLGQWEGKTHSSIKELYQTEFESFWNTPHLFTTDGGETFEETRARVIQVLNRIKREYKSGNILIVTHSVAIKCLYSFLKNSPIETLWDPPYIHDTSLTIVEMNENGFKLVLEGDITHLESVNFI